MLILGTLVLNINHLAGQGQLGNSETAPFPKDTNLFSGSNVKADTGNLNSKSPLLGSGKGYLRLDSINPSRQDSTSISPTRIKNELRHIGYDSLKKIFSRDSAHKTSLLKKAMPQIHGTLGAGYEYGIIPFASNTNFPYGYYKSEGNLSVSSLGLPVNVSYFYSSIHNVVGLNNYFRVSFDERQYKENLRNYNAENLLREKERLGKLYGEEQDLKQGLAFCDFSRDLLLHPEVQNYEKIPGVRGVDSAGILQKDSSLLKINGDSTGLGRITNFKDSGAVAKLVPVNAGGGKIDSIMRVASRYEKDLERVQNLIVASRRKIAILENPEMLAEDNSYLKKGQKILAGVKKMEVGLCYPNHSTFLVNGTTLKGINLEWEKKQYYLAFTCGKTINTLMTTNNLIQNQLQNRQNLYNFFDFNNVQNSRRIVALKFGLGKREGTHLHVGVLYGTGMDSYVVPGGLGNAQRNLVLEVDGRVLMGRRGCLDLVYGKSSVLSAGVEELPSSSLTRGLFSGLRSNAGLVKYSLMFDKTRTKLIFMGRWVDPFFLSYGVGYMRQDNVRYEARVEQGLGRKSKLTGFFRKDEDNLLKTFLYTTSLYSMGASLMVKISRRFTARATFSPVLQKVVSADNSYNLRNMNNISTGVLTYSPRLKKGSTSFNLLYSYYKLTGTAGNTDFQNFSFNNSTIIGQHFRMDLTGNWFKNSAGDSLNSGTFMEGIDFSYSGGKGILISVGGKAAYNRVTGNQFGGAVRVKLPVCGDI